MASALAFASGAAIPTLLVVLLPQATLIAGVVVATMVVLVILGGLAAQLGGAPLARGALRVAFWGAVAMGFTALIGQLFGTVA
jgi:VIT1/CCC1 family predicted Fe2+/Mn2+ transporter